SIARRKVRAQPEVAEQNVRGVLDDTGKGRAKLTADTRDAVSFRLFVERERRGRSSREPIRPDIARSKHIFCCYDRRHSIRPARVERQMRDHLGDFARLDAIVERKIDVEGQFEGLVAGDQGGEGHDAAIGAAQSAARALTRNPAPRPATLASSPRAGMPNPSATSRNAV